MATREVVDRYYAFLSAVTIMCGQVRYPRGKYVYMCGAFVPVLVLIVSSSPSLPYAPFDCCVTCAYVRAPTPAPPPFHTHNARLRARHASPCRPWRPSPAGAKVARAAAACGTGMYAFIHLSTHTHTPQPLTTLAQDERVSRAHELRLLLLDPNFHTCSITYICIHDICIQTALACLTHVNTIQAAPAGGGGGDLDEADPPRAEAGPRGAAQAGTVCKFVWTCVCVRPK